MEKKQNRRIDRLLHILLKIARDKVFGRVIKTQKGKMTYRLSEINKRHQVAEKIALSEGQLSSLSNTSWKVLSTSSKQSQYTVTKVMTQSCSCSLLCSSCGVCVHSYVCTCMDFILHSTVCKHIHLVEMNNSSKKDELSSEKSSTANDETALDNSISIEDGAVSNQTENETDVSSLQYLSKCLVNSKSTDYASTVEKAVSLCKKIEVSLLECTSLEAIKRGTKHLTAALTVIKSIESNATTNEQCFPTRKRPAPNSNAE